MWAEPGESETPIGWMWKLSHRWHSRRLRGQVGHVGTRLDSPNHTALQATHMELSMSNSQSRQSQRRRLKIETWDDP